LCYLGEGDGPGESYAAGNRQDEAVGVTQRVFVLGDELATVR
jgi:hypothetical protein